MPSKTSALSVHQLCHFLSTSILKHKAILKIAVEMLQLLIWCNPVLQALTNQNASAPQAPCRYSSWSLGKVLPQEQQLFGQLKIYPGTKLSPWFLR